MENEYYAYINYMLFKDYDDNDLMKKITLPDGKKIDKYIFYSEIKKIFALWCVFGYGQCYDN